MEDYLKNTVEKLAVPSLRNASGEQWNQAMELMETLIREAGYSPATTSWEDEENRFYKNFSVTFTGKVKEKLIFGAHYDTFETTPGADDNGSAVAVLLGILKELPKDYSTYFTIEIIFFSCEEPPFYGTDQMGSAKAAALTHKNEVELMICLEMVGYFSDEEKSQEYPFWPFKWLYGTKGNFLLGVGNKASKRQAKKYLNRLQLNRPNFYRKLILPFTIEGIGLDWSDHRNYWEKEIPAIMLTDTAVFRNKNYHTETDTPSTLDYRRMAYLVEDLRKLMDQMEK